MTSPVMTGDTRRLKAELEEDLADDLQGDLPDTVKTNSRIISMTSSSTGGQ
jgi:hypothetical protein